MSDSVKRAREGSSKFVSAHHEKAEMSWDQERKLRLSCEFRHLRYRHSDDLVMLIQKICQENMSAERSLQDILARFTQRDNVKPGTQVALSQEQQVYAKRISDHPKDLRYRYPGDLAQIIEFLVEHKHSTEESVQNELQRINVVQSDARKKLR